ncbi:MFS transporter [Photobacterium jeanii]|uniref:MFS transporter n=1 Tax=Photobacterium jeanii TaxID=858640 RepID=A0A178K3A0_9GAMM|nr:MFS transporter [Photobacterium jeanii]OAN11204.1 MFS transporter [Photobacterium jeanii]PST90724.1 MFS transporter [Photobacterium jeanii]
MSLFSMPFVGSGVDTTLHVIAGVVMVGTIAAAAFGFWRLHELPIKKAHSKEHHQLGLITVLTWIGFIWHWVWVIAVVIAFVDGEQALRRIRDIWKGEADNNERHSATSLSANDHIVSSQTADNKVAAKGVTNA